MSGPGIHRPRNLDWKRAAALLYGDWGTSKAYVIGLAFVAAAYSAFPIIVAVCALTAVVGYNYIVICKHFPDGGGVYSAARKQSRVLAVMGALLLVANFTVTATLSAWAAMSYFGVPPELIRWSTMATILAIGTMNYFGPKHTGNFAMVLAAPMVIVVAGIILLSLPHLTLANLEPPHRNLPEIWMTFTGVILALSGVEAVANLTGVMKLDPGSTMDRPNVGQTARQAILPVAIEVVAGTVLLGWAMLSLPRDVQPLLEARWEDMMRFLGEQYGTMAFGENFGRGFGFAVGLVVGLLLLSAVNTAVGALIGLVYMLARDGEMPRSFTQLNPHGVPWMPLGIATVLPLAVAAAAPNLVSLAGLYAIGVVGAIAVNLGSCTFNRELALRWYERAIMGLTFVVLFLVELTIAKTKHDALFFVVCVLGAGMALRAYSQKRAGLRTVTVSERVSAGVTTEPGESPRTNLTPGQSILVAARGLTPVLPFAMEEARFRQGPLYVLYVKEIAVTLPGSLESVEPARWQDDREATTIMTNMLESGKENNVPVIPLYVVSDNPAATILDLSATLGIDFLILGARHRRTLAQLFKGDVANRVAKDLPENIQLIIYS
jgi:amino acid transporter/nucleotide-binding universal stress UspA family protein